MTPLQASLLEDSIGAVVDFVKPAATDLFLVGVTCERRSIGTRTRELIVVEPGHVFPIGYHAVTCTATDQSANTISHSFSVTVEDKEAPVLTVPPTTVTADATSADGVSAFPG